MREHGGGGSGCAALSVMARCAMPPPPLTQGRMKGGLLLRVTWGAGLDRTAA